MNDNNRERRAILNANLQLTIRERADRRGENSQAVLEFAVVMPDVSDKDARDIVLFSRNCDESLAIRLQYIHRSHAAYPPQHYE